SCPDISLTAACLMPDTSAKPGFARELNDKLDELIQWAIENSPVQEPPLTQKDFTDIRKSFLATAIAGTPLMREPEPSEGGAQYITDNPAPWPSDAWHAPRLLR